PTDAPGHGGRRSVRRHPRVHRHDRRVRADSRWTRRLHPGAGQLGLLPWHRGRRPGPGGCHRPVSVPGARGLRHSDPALGPSHGSAVRAVKTSRAWRRAGLYLLVLGFVLFAAFPFIWGSITTFKQDQALYKVGNNPFLFNRPPTLMNVTLLLFPTPVPPFARQTLLVGRLRVPVRPP